MWGWDWLQGWQLRGSARESLSVAAAVAQSGAEVAVRQRFVWVGGDGAAGVLLAQLDAAAPAVQLAQVEEHGRRRAIRRDAQGGLPRRASTLVVTAIGAPLSTVVVVYCLSGHGGDFPIVAAIRGLPHLVLSVVREVFFLDPGSSDSHRTDESARAAEYDGQGGGGAGVR